MNATIPISADTKGPTTSVAEALGGSVRQIGEGAFDTSGFPEGGDLLAFSVRTCLARALADMKLHATTRGPEQLAQIDLPEFTAPHPESPITRDLLAAWATLAKPSPPATFVFHRAGAEKPAEAERRSTEEELEMVDWDVRIETPPSRPTRRIEVVFRKGGYRRPRIVDDPED